MRSRQLTGRLSREACFVRCCWAGGCCAVGGVGVGKDASATLALKAFFARARPSSDFIAAPSFPSGHSTSVFAVMGLLFLVLLPTLNALSPRQSQASDNSSESSGKGLLAAVAQPRVGLAATFAGSSVTVAGRLLADVHWATDTMAGAPLRAHSCRDDTPHELASAELHTSQVSVCNLTSGLGCTCRGTAPRESVSDRAAAARSDKSSRNAQLRQLLATRSWA